MEKLTNEQLKEVNGGGVLGDAWNGVKEFAGGVVDGWKGRESI